MYKVKFFYGDYSYRQKMANKSNAIVYIEHHFNSDYKGVGNYASALVASNASNKSIEIANTYTRLVGEEFRIPYKVIKLKRGQRGNRNLLFTKMPAVLLEPLFVSNIEHVDILLRQNGISRLAECLSSTINKHFPEGGLIAFSVGHKYKRSKPYDRGAIVHGRPQFTEADLAEWVLWYTANKLNAEIIIENS